MVEGLIIGIERDDYQEPYLPKAPPGMFTKQLPELDAA